MSELIHNDDGTLTEDAKRHIEDHLTSGGGRTWRQVWPGCCARPLVGVFDRLHHRQCVTVDKPGVVTIDQEFIPLFMLFCQNCGRARSYLLSIAFPSLAPQPPDPDTR